VGVDAEHGRVVMKVAAVSALSDNYIWLLHDEEVGHTAVVDPGDGQAVLDGAARHGWRIDQVLITHWHPDHTAGIPAVVGATGAKVWGPEAERDRFAGLDHGLAEGDRVMIGSHEAEVWHAPGHTLGHIAYIFAGHALVGDTLFAGGCGRLFEGTPDQMHESLQRLRQLPDETIVYPAHEYTLGNYRFLAAEAPGDPAVARRLTEVAALREAGRPTVPTTIAEEKSSNLFLRAANASEFARLRAGKDSFR
jgi:hydroxyacylglutathione hydrolase